MTFRYCSHIVGLIAVHVLSTTHSYGGETSSGMPLSVRYDWRLGSAYDYAMRSSSILTNGWQVARRAEPTPADSRFTLSVISRSEQLTHVAWDDSRIPNHTVFVKIDDLGRACIDRIYTDIAEYVVTNTAAFREAWHAVNSLYGSSIWELPTTALSNGICSVSGIEMEYSLTNGLCIMHTRDGVFRRTFDLKHGFLKKSVLETNGSKTDLSLVRIRDLNTGERERLTARFDEALTIDAFESRAFAHYVWHDDPAVQIMAFRMLRNLIATNDAAYEEIMEAALGTDVDGQLMRTGVTPMLEGELQKGAARAIRLFLTSEQLLTDRHASLNDECAFILSEVAGLRLGTGRKAWTNWYERVKEGLPRMGDSSTQELLAGVRDKDAWCRLLALRLLFNREGLTHQAVFESALSDENETVRAFAADVVLREERK